MSAEGEGSPPESPGGSSDSGEGVLLSATLDGDALARSLVDVTTANELGLVRSEVRRLRSKIEALEREKDDMVENFRSTTKILLNRIKELEAEVRPSTSRPNTAAVIERMEGGKTKPPVPRRDAASSSHVPEVLRIEEEPHLEAATAAEAAEVCDKGDVAPALADAGEVCGNCGRVIPGGNLVSHSVYCYRNNYRCTACDEVLALRDRDSHMREWTDPQRLIEAVSRRDVTTVRLMGEHGADFSTATHPATQDTVLHAAARLGDVELISFFMGYGVDVDPRNNAGETPLHLAAESVDPQGDPRALRLLVDLGSNLNLPNGQGDTALMLVCRRGNAMGAKYLAEQKADPQAQTKIGDTALQIAQRLGFQEVVLALCTAGAPLRSGTPSRARSGSPMLPQGARHGRALSGGSGTPTAGSRPVSPSPGKAVAGGGARAAGYPPRPSRDKRAPSPGCPVPPSAVARSAARG